jgi:hypothetical protein
MSEPPIQGPWRNIPREPIDNRSFWVGWGCGCVMAVPVSVGLVLLGMWLNT